MVQGQSPGTTYKVNSAGKISPEQAPLISATDEIGEEPDGFGLSKALAAQRSVPSRYLYSSC